MNRHELGSFECEGKNICVSEYLNDNGFVEKRNYRTELQTEMLEVVVTPTQNTCIHSKLMNWGWDRKWVHYELEITYSRGEVLIAFVVAKIDYERYEIKANDCGELDAAIQSVEEILYRTKNENWFLQSNLAFIELCTSKIDELVGSKPNFKDEDIEELPF